MTDQFIEYVEGGIRVECWNCGGEGLIANCQDEWACIDPESGCDLCTKRCDICDGKGSYIVKDKP